MTEQAKNRRKSARAALFMLVRTKLGPVWAFDISMGGMKVYTRDFIDIGTFLDLEFNLPGESDQYRVGAQVTDMAEAKGGGLSLGLRFCRPNPKLTMDLYRFLDGRRATWDETVINAVPPPSPWLENPRPFEGLLLEAFAALRLKEVNRSGFVRRGPSRDLLTLSRVLGKEGKRSASVERADRHAAAAIAA